MRVAVPGSQPPVELEVAVTGEGPLVVLVHGFPELGYSWRHQVPALVDAGWRVAVPDLRGYGASSRPEAIEAYDILHLTGDLTAILDALGEDEAVFVGHDWGAAIVWQLAVLAPERVRAVAGLSVPFMPRAPVAPVQILRARHGDDFYICWFQEPGVADAVLAADVRRTLIAGDAWTSAWGSAQTPATPPPWLTEEDLAVYVEAFARTGFTGALNYYRNMDRNWELTAAVEGRRVTQPALFVTGADDPVHGFMPADHLAAWVTDLRGHVVLQGAGHWIQQERPDEVNAALLGFLAGL